MTYNNMSQACIISILESRAYILYIIRKTDDVLYANSAYPCVEGVERVLANVGLPYYIYTSG